MPRRTAAEQSRLRAVWTLLRWQRRVSNAEVRAVTGVATVQASRLLSGLAESHPDALALDRRSKQWQLVTPAAARDLGGGLDEYLATANAANLNEGWIHDARPSFLAPDESRIALIRAACLNGTGLDVTYASISSTAETRRTLFPHALVRTAARWHIRAWCMNRQEYRDFNIGRIHDLKLSSQSATRLPVDTAWENILDLRIVAHPDLDLEQERTIRREYFSGTVARRIKVREPLAPYLLQDLRVATDVKQQHPPDYLLAMAASSKKVTFAK